MSSQKAVLYGTNFKADANQLFSDTVGKSGFTTVILFSINTNQNGDILHDGSTIVSGGKVDAAFQSIRIKEGIQLLKTGTVKRVFFSMGGSGAKDITTVSNMNDQTYNTFVGNLKALVAYTQVDGFDFDTEETYGNNIRDALVKVTMTLAMDMHLLVTYCPYQNEGFWISCLQQVYSKAGNKQLVTWFNLQCYAGGVGNQPATWKKAVIAANVGVQQDTQFIVAGLDSNDSTQTVQTKLHNFNNPANTLSGGFLWESKELFADKKDVQQYAQAIIKAFPVRLVVIINVADE